MLISTGLQVWISDSIPEIVCHSYAPSAAEISVIRLVV